MAPFVTVDSVFQLSRDLRSRDRKDRERGVFRAPEGSPFFFERPINPSLHLHMSENEHHPTRLAASMPNIEVLHFQCWASQPNLRRQSNV